MTKIIKVPQETVDTIQALQYEVESRKDLLAYMAGKGFDTDNDAFRHYHQEYQTFFIKFCKAKEQMEAAYLRPAAGGKLLSWDLNFASGEVSCEVACS